MSDQQRNDICAVIFEAKNESDDILEISNHPSAWLTIATVYGKALDEIARILDYKP